MIQMEPTPSSQLDPNRTLSAATDLSEGTRPPGVEWEREGSQLTQETLSTSSQFFVLIPHTGHTGPSQVRTWCDPHLKLVKEFIPTPKNYQTQKQGTQYLINQSYMGKQKIVLEVCHYHYRHSLRNTKEMYICWRNTRAFYVGASV